ncbi:DUF2505 family protein [Spirochaetota bacterium]
MKKGPKEVARILSSKDFLVSIEKQREEVVAAEYRVLKKTDNILEFEIMVTGYRHNKFGQMDKNETRTNVSYYKWNKSKNTISVLWPGSGRIRIAGVYGIKPEGTGTRLSYEIEVDVRIPIMGPFIAGRIRNEMESSFNKLIEKLK